ncbi:hypothetical protein [Hymenobacter sp.]|uniref:hypothetical protein n=1 Tax=Hymenobacter sp. TaxID=1898978 RepID=UPI00286C8B32|nr:hypothetical protein [Hymenobacter sp.]
MKKLCIIICFIAIRLPHFCHAQLNPLAEQKALASDSLIGAWTMSATEHIWINKSYKSQVTQTTTRIVCNACPTVILDSNHTGQIISANGIRQTFEWSRSGSELKVMNHTPKRIKANSTLQDGVYSIAMSQGSLGENILRLLDAKATTYVLVKEYP